MIGSFFFLGFTLNWTNIIWIVIPTFIIFVAISFLLGRFWCGFVCPVGTILDFIGIMYRRVREKPETKYPERYWCRSLCPLGMFWSLFNKISPLRMSRDTEKCTPTMCGQENICVKICPMENDVLDEGFQGLSCIRCLECVYSCETEAIRAEPPCPLLLWMNRKCTVYRLKAGLLSSPLGSIYLYLKMKLFGFKSIKSYRDAFLCTQCNKCYLASLRSALMKSFIEHGAEPRNLTMLRNAIVKYGNPYGKPEFRFALLEKNYNNNNSSRVFFAGCTPTYRAPELFISALELLEDSKIEFSIMPEEICCGFPLYTQGYVKEAHELAQQNVKMFEEKGVKEIITACPGCYQAFKTFYKRFPSFKVQVKHIFEVIVPKSELSRLSITIHDPCHLNEKIAKVAWKALEGCRVRATKEPCCGGIILPHNPQIATEIAQRTIKATTDRHITTLCPLCYLTLSRIEPKKMIDIYTLLRASSGKDIRKLKEWRKELHERARLLRRRRRTKK